MGRGKRAVPLLGIEPSATRLSDAFHLQMNRVAGAPVLSVSLTRELFERGRYCTDRPSLVELCHSIVAFSARQARLHLSGSNSY